MRSDLKLNKESLHVFGIGHTTDTIASGGDTIPPTVSIEGPLKMQVLGDNFWEIITEEFGSTVSGLGKAMLPLQFSQNDCNLTNLSATLLELSQSGLLHGSGDTESNEAEVAAFWLR